MGILKRQYLNDEGVFDSNTKEVCAKCTDEGPEDMLCLIKGARICMYCFWAECERL